MFALPDPGAVAAVSFRSIQDPIGALQNGVLSSRGSASVSSALKV